LKQKRKRKNMGRPVKAHEAQMKYSLRPIINAILGLGTQTNMRCEMTKLPLVSYENDLDISLSFV
jgi:hypothetical protein